MRVMNLLTGLLASTALAIPAMAQTDNTPSAQQASTRNADSSDIVVIAQRRETRYVDVPASVSVVTGEQLGSSGISGTRDLQLLTPGLNISQQGTYVQPTIRGVGTTVVGPSVDPNIGLYIDGVYMSSMGAALFDFNSVSQIEVLKGPQGTLYGRNATGGAIVVSTKEPSLTENSGSLEFGYGRFEEVRANAYANVVLSDNVALNVSAYTRSNDGYTVNVFNGLDTSVTKSLGVRGRLLVEPNDGLRIILTAAHVDQKDNTAFSYVPYQGNSIFPTSDAAIIGLTDKRKVSLSEQPYNELRLTMANLNIDWSGEWGALTSVSAYTKSLIPFATDLDGTEVDLQVFYGDPQSSETWSQELIYSSPDLGAISFTGGLFYFKEKAGSTANVTSFGSSVFGLDVFAKADAFAAFLQGTFDITERLHLTAGGRYSTEKKKTKSFFGVGGPLVVDASKRFSDFTPQASLLYDLSGSSSVYVSYSEGFKSGLFDGGNLGDCPVVGPTCPYEGDPVAPEKVKSYEAGFKYNAGRTVISLSGYYTKYKDIQVNALATNALGVPNQQILYNAAEAEIYGGEAELSMKLSDFFRFSSGAAWTHSEYTDFPQATKWTPILDDAGNPVGGNQLDPDPSATGNQLYRTPEFTAFVSGTATYQLPKGSLEANATASYSDSFFWHVNNRLKQPSFVVVNASLTWFVDDNLKLKIWGENLTDERRLVYPREANVGDFVSYSKPLSYGATIGYEF